MNNYGTQRHHLDRSYGYQLLEISKVKCTGLPQRHHLDRSYGYQLLEINLCHGLEISFRTSPGLKITFKFFTEVLFLSIILCLANTGIVNVLVSTLYSKPDEVTGYECGLYSTKGGRLKDRISFYTVGLTMMIFDVEVVLTFAFLLSLTFATTSSFLSVGIFVVILGLDLF